MSFLGFWKRLAEGKGTIALVGIGILLYAPAALAASARPVILAKKPLPPVLDFSYRTETQFRASHDRQIAVTELWQPIWQTPDQIFYGSVRAMSDRQANFEGNFGFGYRALSGPCVRGGYVYLDRRVTAMGSAFWQGTFGGEYITRGWEARANIYVPLPQTYRYVSAVDEAPYIAGTGVFVRTPGEVIEEAQPGFDAEVGFTLPNFSRYIDSARVFGGVYSFQGDQTPTLTGVRTRLSVDLASWMSVGARAQYDDERGSQYFAEVTFSWPGRPRVKEMGLRARLADSPERDIDIVTGNIEEHPATHALVHAQTGAPVRVLYVDNTAAMGGDGEAEKPFATLADAVAAAHPYDTIYVAKGDGTTAGYDAGYVLSTPHVQVVGAGTNLVLKADDLAPSDAARMGGDLVLRPVDDYPLITHASGDGVQILASDITISGLQIDGAGGHGVYVASDGAVLDHLRITGNDGSGVVVVQSGTDPLTVRVRDSALSGNAAYGVLTQNTGGGALQVDLGRADDYGLNDFDGNIASDVHADTGGSLILAQGNYWTASGAPRLSGPDQGGVDTAVAVASPFCTDCAVAPVAFSSPSAGAPGARISFSPVTVTGFRGHRYLLVSGDGAPTWRVNGIDSGVSAVRASAGDVVGIDMTLSSSGLTSRTISVFGAGIDAQGSATTQFLPNAMTNLVAWWDAADIDGDFTAAGQPTDGASVLSWVDKTGYGHTATSSGAFAPTYAAAAAGGRGGVLADGSNDFMSVSSSGYLAALSPSATAALVISGAPTGSGTQVFRYGTCTGAAASRCFALVQAGNGVNGAVRMDTSAARNQVSDPVPIFDGTAHIVWLAADGAGTVSLTKDGAGMTDTYSLGGGWLSGAGMRPVGALNGTYYEMLLFNGAVGSTDRALIDTYLTDKWGL